MFFKECYNFLSIVGRKNENLFQDLNGIKCEYKIMPASFEFWFKWGKMLLASLNGMEILWRKSKRGPPSNSASNATWWIENNRLTGFQDRMESTRISNSFWSWNAIFFIIAGAAVVSNSPRGNHYTPFHLPRNMLLHVVLSIAFLFYW